MEICGVDGRGVVASDEGLKLGEAGEEKLGEQFGGGRQVVGIWRVEIETGVLDAERGVGDVESGEKESERAALGQRAETNGVGQNDGAHGSSFLRGGGLLGLGRREHVEK